MEVADKGDWSKLEWDRCKGSKQPRDGQVGLLKVTTLTLPDDDDDNDNGGDCGIDGTWPTSS